MEWKKFFRNHILERGYNYYKDGVVEIKEMTDDHVEAVVAGTESYTVYIEFEDLRTMQCTCPHFGSGNFCKHLAAVFYAIEDKLNVEEIKENHHKSALLKNWKEAFFHLLAKKQEEEPTFENELDRIFYKYNESKTLSLELKRYFHEVLEPHVVENFNKESFDMMVDYYERMVDKAEQLDYQLFEMLKPLWRHYIISSKGELHTYIFQWFNHRVQKSMLIHRDIRDLYCKYFNEGEFREDKVSTLNQKILYFAHNEYQRREVRVYLEARLDASENVFDYMSLYSGNIDMIEFFVFYMTKRLRQKETIDFLKDCMEKNKDDIDYLKRVGDLLCHVYESCMMINELKEELILQLQTFNKGDLNVYHRLEKLYSSEKWQIIRKTL